MAASRLRTLLCRALLVALACVLAWLASVLVRGARDYASATAGRGWRGRLHLADPELGLRPRPLARGAETFPLGPDVAACVDAAGFRVPADPAAAAGRERPLVLALGCSYTWGAACRAEESFPFLVARGLGGRAVDAGVCSHGLAQMLLLARRLVPGLRPDFVLFQHSPWLAERSRRRTAPTYFGRVPTPAFVERGGALVLDPPRGSARVLELPLELYSRETRGVLDFLSFQWRVALPLYLHDDAQLLGDLLSGARGEPASAERIVESVHAEVEALCAASGARLVYVALDEDLVPAPLPPAMLRGPALVADATGALRAELALPAGASPQEQREAYQRAYAHWAGDPPVLVDLHPNARAHAVIAETVLRVLGERR